MEKKVLDCMYEACPIPLLRVVKEIDSLNIGDIIVVQADHTCALVNIEEWTQMEGHGYDYVEIEPGVWEIYVEKRR